MAVPQPGAQVSGPDLGLHPRLVPAVAARGADRRGPPLSGQLPAAAVAVGAQRRRESPRRHPRVGRRNGQRIFPAVRRLPLSLFFFSFSTSYLLP